PEQKTTYPIEKEDTTVSVQKHPKFSTYWNTGKAEITSYALTQSRYGQIHQGTAVNIFVTEEFLPNKQVKADNLDENNISILKLNSTKKFVTGIYPYSIMTSTFTPIYTSQKAIKITFSSQEWCGNTFVQLNNRAQFEIDFRSYFETNADKKIVLKKNILENDLWNLLRINPKKLPTGNFNSIPSFEFLALNHQKIAAYEANASLKEEGDFITYSIYYPSLKRELIIKATKEFPFTIESWKETFTKNGKENTSEATKIKTIQTAYWKKKRVTDTKERTLLGL
ncbi:MAG: septum formation inhibitor Maf, partial [Polaribacter sp.]|nr:septum formation inhibitor Maf [Polaribacter sp.]